MQNKSHKMIINLVMAGLLTALAIVIPLFSPRITIPPFTLTFASHVPIIIAALISPFITAIVCVGATIGFFLSAPIYVAARAATHIVFALFASFMFRRLGRDKITTYVLIALISSVIHAVFEFIIVLPFGFGLESFSPLIFDTQKVLASLLTVGAGTFIHSAMDFTIAFIIYKSLSGNKVFKNI